MTNQDPNLFDTNKLNLDDLYALRREYESLDTEINYWKDFLERIEKNETTHIGIMESRGSGVNKKTYTSDFVFPISDCIKKMIENDVLPSCQKRQVEIKKIFQNHHIYFEFLKSQSPGIPSTRVRVG